MRDIIQLLPDHVANQIAAGEVVQRPASVVKELLENAIDAQASQINLLIKDGGKTLIQVTDNGIGMSTTDARLSFERHATSKIKVAEDLFHLNTKGFRGEALASIAAIAYVDMQTKRADDEVGTSLIIKGSKVEKQEPCVTPVGTVIRVKNLFFNIPARRNFLKSQAVETRHIIDEFQRVALAHPHIAFSLHHNGSELFQLHKTNFRQRIVAVFGGKTNEKLVPIAEETDLIKISGFVGKPKFAKRTKGEQFFFVNHRFIKSPYLRHAVNAAYEGLLPDKKYPAYFIYFEINPQAIDINIHPTKTEIKFDDEHAIYAILRSAAKHSLGQFNVSPSLDFSHNSELDTPYSYRDRNPEIPKIEVDHNFNPFKDDKPSDAKNKSTPFYEHQKKSADWESLYTDLNTEVTVESGATNFSSVQFESEAVTGSLFATEDSNPQAGIFQLQKKYIVSALKGGMLLIHQHRAHFRILFEEFLKNITVEATLSQQLLFPLVLNLTQQETAMLVEIKDSLEQIGFDFIKITTEEVRIGGIPGMISESAVPAILDEVLADVANGVPKQERRNAQFLARILAKNTAVKSGTSLTLAEQVSIINQLFACKESTLTPDNQKIFMRFVAEDFDKNF